MVNAKSEEISREIETLKSGAPPPPTFNVDRESILADVALGKADAADLKRSDDETAAAMKTYDSIVKGIREKTSPLEATVAGLKRKAAIGNRTIDALRAEHRRLCLAYLLQQAEEAGKEYAAAATRMVKAQDLVIVFASLHKRAGGENFIGDGMGEIDIPPLGLASTRGTLPPLDPVARTAAYDAAEVAVLDGLNAEGLAITFPPVVVLTPAKAHAPGIGEGFPVSIVRPEPEEGYFPDGHVRPTRAVTEE
jgi:hypothetical protein